MKRAIILTFGALVTVAALGATVTEPKITFGPEGVTIEGVKPGTRVAWMALVRERIGRHTQVRVLRGIQSVTPQPLKVKREAIDLSRSVWIVANVDEAKGVRAIAPDYAVSARPIATRLAVGQTSFAVQSASVEVLYIRAKGGAWSFTGGDGGTLDGDGSPDGWITVPLASMDRFKGHPSPPAMVDAGDLILLIDPHHIRTMMVEVGR